MGSKLGGYVQNILGIVDHVPWKPSSAGTLVEQMQETMTRGTLHATITSLSETRNCLMHWLSLLFPSNESATLEYWSLCLDHLHLVEDGHICILTLF